jgi:hypothetical protein
MQKKLLNKINISCLLALGTSTSAWACNASHVLGTGNAATAYTISAEVMEKGSFFIGLTQERLRNKKLADATILQALNNGSEHLHHVGSIDTHSLSMSYGITKNLSVNVQLPYISRTDIRAGENETGPEVHPHNNIEDLGDASVLFQYKVYDKAYKVALIGGLKAPTGEDHVIQEGEKIEADLLSGTGSWDIFAGASLTKDFKAVSIHSDILYKYNSEGVDESKLGNVLTYNVALSYKIIDHKAHNELTKSEKDSGYEVSGFVELNGESAQSDEFHHVVSENTGHNVIFATVGAQFGHHDGYSLFVAFSKPIHQHFKGIQNEIDYRSSFGVGKSF